MQFQLESLLEEAHIEPAFHIPFPPSTLFI
jgi:hypothetical protein